MRKTTLIVHLIHGTWPEGIWVSLKRWAWASLPYTPEKGSAFWFQSEHGFCRQLADQLTAAGFAAELRPFVWSGANSFAARAQAADEFVPHLAAGIHDGVRQLIVAHSHGGTVAMLAMRQIETGATPGAFGGEATLRWMPARRGAGNALTFPVESIVALTAQSMREGLADLELTTLATPFLRVEPFGLTTRLWSAFNLLWMTAFAAVAVAVAKRYGQDMSYVAMSAMTFTAILIAGVIARARQLVERLIVGPQAIRFVGKRIQCIRGVADEAELGISAGIVGCSAVRALLVLVGRGLARTTVVVIMGAYLAAIAVLTLATIADPGSRVVVWLYVFGAVALAFIVLLALASSMQSMLGVELAACGFGWLTSVESSPDADRHRIEVVTLASTANIATGLRHAIYLHPQCAARIVAGLRS